ncbi:MAG: hypothetical protein LRY28_02465 [Erysipelotrichaceae bacterium]|nr:hypothetical protein [Erysipelotrichaceae bacterium]
MPKSIIKRAGLKWSGLFILSTLVMLLIGNTIISEGIKLIFSSRVTEKSDFATSNAYQFNVPLSSEYTDVDFEIEYQGKEIRFKGFINELNDGYYFVFTQQEVKENTLFILSRITFSQENMTLIRDAMIAQIAEDTGLSEDEVSALIYPEIMLDHTQRIINYIPIVLVWLVIFIGLLWLSIRTTFKYIKLTRNQELQQATLWAKDYNQGFKNKERYILSSGLLQCGLNPVYVSYNDILLYEKDAQGMTLKTKTLVFKIQASDKLYDEIVKKVVPEFVINTNKPVQE